MFGYKDPLRQMKIVGGNGMATLGKWIFYIIGILFLLGILGRQEMMEGKIDETTEWQKMVGLSMNVHNTLLLFLMAKMGTSEDLVSMRNFCVNEFTRVGDGGKEVIDAFFDAAYNLQKTSGKV